MNRFLLVPSKGKDGQYEIAGAIAARLQRSGGTVFVPERFSGGNLPGVQYVPNRVLPPEAETVIVLGGDGAMLNHARMTAGTGIPLLGINLGRVGYMADLEPDELELLDHLFTGEYRFEDRMMLQAIVNREGLGPVVTMPALNEIVLTHGTVSRLLDIDLTCNGQPAGDYRADGLIFATPTGSTAYSMSAGGPVLDPLLHAYCVTPICPNAMTMRPMVFPSETELTAACRLRKGEEWSLTVDGRDNLILSRGDTVRIRKAEATTRFLNLKQSTFCNVLRRKAAKMF